MSAILSEASRGADQVAGEGTAVWVEVSRVLVTVGLGLAFHWAFDFTAASPPDGEPERAEPAPGLLPGVCSQQAHCPAAWDFLPPSPFSLGTLEAKLF